MTGIVIENVDELRIVVHEERMEKIERDLSLIEKELASIVNKFNENTAYLNCVLEQQINQRNSQDEKKEMTFEIIK